MRLQKCGEFKLEAWQPNGQFLRFTSCITDTVHVEKAESWSSVDLESILAKFGRYKFLTTSERSGAFLYLTLEIQSLLLHSDNEDRYQNVKFNGPNVS